MGQKKVILRDWDIRQALLAKLEKRKDEKFSRIVQEPQMMRSQLDVLVVRVGMWEGFEIKSDADYLDKLPIQVICFQAPHLMTLVATERHIQKAMEIIPKEWGVTVASKGRFGVKLDAIRKPTPSGSLDHRINMLHMKEVRKMIKGVSRMEHDEVMANLRRMNMLDSRVSGMLMSRERSWGATKQTMMSQPLRKVLREGERIRKPHPAFGEVTYVECFLECGHMVEALVNWNKTVERRRCGQCGGIE